MNCGYDGIRVYDFTQPSSPAYLNSLSFYNQQGYNHQGWLSPDKKTYVFTDETQGLKIKKCSVSDDWTITPTQFFGTSNSTAELTAHNVQITNNLAFVSYYNAGLRIYDLRMNPPGEIAAYDTYLLPDATNFTMWGAWGVYALYKSDRILVSDRNNGLFLFKFDRPFFDNQSDLENFSAYPNPLFSGQNVVIRSPNDFIKDFHYTVYDVQGKEIQHGRSGNNTFVALPMELAAGIYLIELRYENYLFEQSSYILRIEII